MPEILASGAKTVFHYRCQCHPAQGLRAMGGADPQARRALARALWLGRVTPVVLRSLERAESRGLLDRAAGRLFKLYLLYGGGDQRGGQRAAGRRSGDRGNAWIKEFVEFCQNSVPADFVSTHHYPTNALGSIGEDTETQLAHSQGRSPAQESAQKSHRKAQGKPLYYTEWSSSPIRGITCTTSPIRRPSSSRP